MAYKDKLPILKNFVEMGITQDVSSVDTTIYVTNASLFPAVVPGADYIPCVIRWSGSTREVVHVVAVNTAANTITVERGKEGTAAQSWPSGSFLYATLTAQAQTDILNNIWIRCRQSNGNAVAVTVESATSFSLPGDWRDSLEPMMALRILANGSFLSTENGIYIDSVSYTASTGKTLVIIRGTSLPAKVAAIEHSLSSRAVSQSKEVQEYRNLVERVSANLNASEKTCIENADRAQAAAAKLTFSSAINSTKEDCAATPLAVKKAYDRGSAGITAAGNAQTAANNALAEAGKKLPLSGGTLTGNLLFPVVESEVDVKTLRLGIKATDTDGTVRTFFPFRIIPGTTYGRGIVFTSGGPVILGGGESAQTFAKGHIGAGNLNGETEYTFITSDSGIEFYYGQNAGYDVAKKIAISAAGAVTIPGNVTIAGNTNAKGSFNGLGSQLTSSSATIAADLNTLNLTGWYAVRPATLNKPGDVTYAVCMVVAHDNNEIHQHLFCAQGIYHRYISITNSVYKAWTKLFDSNYACMKALTANNAGSATALGAIVGHPVATPYGKGNQKCKVTLPAGGTWLVPYSQSVNFHANGIFLDAGARYAGGTVLFDDQANPSDMHQATVNSAQSLTFFRMN